MIVNEYIMMVYTVCRIDKCGAFVISEAIKMNHTLTSLDMRGEWNNKEIKKKWINKDN